MMFSRLGKMSWTIAMLSLCIDLQQLAAVLTAVLCTLVEKKSRNIRTAAKPPSLTTACGYSDEIFSRVYISAGIFILACGMGAPQH